MSDRASRPIGPALYAVLLGALLILVAASSSHAAVGVVRAARPARHSVVRTVDATRAGHTPRPAAAHR